jgi:hypothetical protein
MAQNGQSIPETGGEPRAPRASLSPPTDRVVAVLEYLAANQTARARPAQRARCI